MWDVVNLSARINEWHHVAIVYDGGECHFYLDGVQTAAQKATLPCDRRMSLLECQARAPTMSTSLA